MKSHTPKIYGPNWCKLKFVGFTRSDLVREGQEAGFTNISARLVTDWADIGLLDHPARVPRGRGEGRGARYEWPDTQKELFLQLLNHRDSVKRISGLCVIPVGLWLYWGDDWVPLGQARRALRTWWDASDVGRLEHSQKSARIVVDAILPGHSPRKIKSELRRVVQQGRYSGRFDVESMVPLVERALSATQGGRWGPWAATPLEVVNGMRAMTVAIDRYDELTDGQFIEVRARHRNNVQNYVRNYPAFSADKKFGGVFEAPSWSLFINRSCSSLLFELGLRLLSLDDGAHLKPVVLTNTNRPPNEMLGIPVEAT